LSTYVPPVEAELAAPSAGGFANFRLIPRIDTYAPVVSYVQTFPGKLLILAVFTAGLAFQTQDWLPLAACLTVISFAPAQRRLLVTASTLVFTFVVPWKSFRFPAYTATILAVILTIGALLYWCATLWPKSWYGRRPVFVLLTGYAALLVAASYIPQGSTIWVLVWLFAHYFSTYVWFIAYSLQDRYAADRDPMSKQLGTYRPFWGSTNTPFSKGSAYLRRIEAKDAAQLAVIQLKGVKLLAWAILVALFGRAYNYWLYEYFRIPTLGQAMALNVSHTPAPWFVCWASLIAGFFGGIISLCVTGHLIIACCRMAGFNALRNTYRPLSSRTVAEFFNRYYFYFKELLVDFFFYPFFMKYFKKNRKLRLVGAIFAAACFGNAYYHFTRDLVIIEKIGLYRALVNYQVYLFYCVALATAISVSQLRKRTPAPEGFVRGQLLPSVSVVFFYCLLDVFGSTERNFPLIEHFRFLAHLFNINL
jgi:hypothetical protein